MSAPKRSTTAGNYNVRYRLTPAGFQATEGSRQDRYRDKPSPRAAREAMLIRYTITETGRAALAAARAPGER